MPQVLLSLLALICLCGCGGDNNSGASTVAGSGNHSTSALEACTERGVAYFKEIGSYPTLSSPPNTGRSANDVARERCTKAVTAFYYVRVDALLMLDAACMSKPCFSIAINV